MFKAVKKQAFYKGRNVLIKKANGKKESKGKGNFSGASFSVWLHHRITKGYVKWVS